MSSPSKICARLGIFLKYVLKKISVIVEESGIEANVTYAESVSFIDSFCKTLEQSYEYVGDGEAVL